MTDDADVPIVGNDDRHNMGGREHKSAVRRRLNAPFVRNRHVEAASRDDSIPGDVLSRSVRDAGLYAHGTVAVEVWVMNPSISKLERPPGGLWVDPAYLASEISNDAVRRLLDESREDYAAPLPLGPGVGLPGALWSDTAEVALETAERWGRMDSKRRGDELERIDIEGGGEGITTERSVSTGGGGSVRKRRRGVKTGGRSDRLASVARIGAGAGAADHRRVVWREVGPLALDPDQPYNPRLILLARAGCGLAAGVRFVLPGGFRGVVIYFARPTAEGSRLKSASNEAYLKRAADVIGACAALEGPRQRCVQQRREEGRDAWRRAKTKIEAVMAVEKANMGQYQQEEGSLRLDQSDAEAGFSTSDFSERLKHRLQQSTEKVKEGAEKIAHIDEARAEGNVRDFCSDRLDALGKYCTKCRGGNNEPPPRFSNWEAAFTFLGVFITILPLTQINRLVKEQSVGEHYLVMGPFGAFATLLYGLTAAPASQPRNAIVGQAVSMSIAVLISYAAIPDWAKETLATSIAVAVMVRCGITHPPAGAAALLFSTSGRDWIHMGVSLLGNVVAIAVAVLWNNLNDRRQYPTFWGAEHWYREVASDLRVGGKDERVEIVRGGSRKGSKKAS